MPVLDAAGAETLARSGLLLDARTGERYRGETEPVDPVAGHIPGAVSAPTAGNVNPDGTFKDAAELAARFASLGARPDGMVGAYCGSGVAAAQEVLALAVAGIPAALYVGSWSNWIADPSRPVATGREATTTLTLAGDIAATGANAGASALREVLPLDQHHRARGGGGAELADRTEQQPGEA